MPTPQEEQSLAATASRVRDLRSQIAFWQSKYAADPTNNNAAPATIDQLQRELNGIPNAGNF